jgi:hypothetical protein
VRRANKTDHGSCLVPQWFDVPEALADVRLEYVSLKIWGRGVCDYNRPPELEEDSFIPIAWAKRIPTLKYIDVQLDDERNGLNCWMIERGGDYNNTPANVRVHVMDHGIATKTRESYGASPSRM